MASIEVGNVPVSGNNAASGAEYRIVVDFSAPDSFRAVQNIGNSGVPGSPHYRDQFAPWLAGEYHIVHLTRAGVEAGRVVTTVIRSIASRIVCGPTEQLRPITSTPHRSSERGPATA